MSFQRNAFQVNAFQTEGVSGAIPPPVVAQLPVGAPRNLRYYYRVTIGDKTYNVKAENLDEFIKSKLRKALKKPVDRVQARRVQKQEEPQVIRELPVYREIYKSNDADIRAALAWAALELAIEIDDEEILPLLIH